MEECRFRLNHEGWMKLHKMKRGKVLCLEDKDPRGNRE